MKRASLMAFALAGLIASCNDAAKKNNTGASASLADTTSSRRGSAGYSYDKSFTDKFSHHTATVNGTSIHYVAGGKGDAILLIHGYPETWHTWHKMMPALAENHTVIAVDLRGLGDSKVTDSGYNKRNLAEDLHLLMEGLGIKKFNVVSHDWGANVGYSLANAYPESVSRLVYAESVVPGFGMEKAMDPANGGLWHFGFFMSSYAEMLTAGHEREFLTKWGYKGDETFAKDSIEQADMDVYINAYTKPGGMTAGFSYYRAIPEDMKYNRANMRKLKMPVLAVGGDHSFGPGVAMFFKAVADNVQPLVIKDCGHFVSEEQPTVFTNAILEFIDKK